MFSKIRQALRTAVQVQHLALLLAWAATVLPLNPPPGHRGYSLGPALRWDPACLPLAHRHPLVRLAQWIRVRRILRLQRRTASPRSTS